MKKRLISLLLVLALVVGICPAAFATNQDSGVYYVDNTETLELSPEEVSKYQQYVVTPETESLYRGKSTLTAEDVLEACALVDTQRIGDYTVRQYTSSLLPNYLFDCNRLVDIATVDDTLYITFETNANETVYLTYTANGLVSQIVYDGSDDTAYMLSDEETIKTLNFRHGTAEIISEELLNTIEHCMQIRDYSEIEDNPHLSIVVDENSNVMVMPKEAENVARATNVPGFTSETALLNNLKSNFPFLNQKVPSGGSGFVYCQYLAKNINFKVVDNRNDYIKLRGDPRTFLASTAISLIEAFLQISTTGTLTLLTGLGIAVQAIGGVQVIMETVKLYNSATYRYTYERYGLVYDSTRFNDYVQVYSSTGVGNFVGGYNSNDQFDWVRSPLSAPEGESISDIKNTCISRYNSELNVYGWCENYYPMGWFN